MNFVKFYEYSFFKKRNFRNFLKRKNRKEENLLIKFNKFSLIAIYKNKTKKKQEKILVTKNLINKCKV